MTKCSGCAHRHSTYTQLHHNSVSVSYAYISFITLIPYFLLSKPWCLWSLPCIFIISSAPLNISTVSIREACCSDLSSNLLYHVSYNGLLQSVAWARKHSFLQTHGSMIVCPACACEQPFGQSCSSLNLFYTVIKSGKNFFIFWDFWRWTSSIPLLKVRSARAGGSSPCLAKLWISPRINTVQPLW